MRNRFPANLSTSCRYGFISATVSLVVAQIITGWLTICGASTQSLVSLLLTTSLAMLVLPKLMPRRNGVLSHPVSSVCLATILTGMSWYLAAAVDRLLYFGVPIVGHTWAFLVPAVYVAAFVIILIVSATVWATNSAGGSSAGIPRSALIGGAGGFLIPLAHGFVATPLALSVSIVAITAALLNTWHRLHSRRESSGLTPNFGQVNLHTVCTTFALGVSLHAVVRLLSGLMPVSVGLLCVAMALCCGISAAVMSRRITDRLTHPYWLFGSVILLSCLPILSNQLVNLNLLANATVSSVMLLTLVRALQVAFFWGVCLACWRGFNSPVENQTSTANTSTIPLILVGIAAAVACSGAGLSVRWEFTTAIVFLVAPLFIVKTAKIEARTGYAVTSRGVWFSTAATALLVILVSKDSATNSQLLFSARAAREYQSGVDPNVIAQSDCQRLLEQHNSNSGAIAVWRTRGGLIELRRDGLPLGTISSNTVIAPQHVADSLTAVLPLVMHQNAQSVLLLGDETGVAMRVCCGFPIHTIEAVRPDPVLTGLAREFAWTSLTTAPHNDDRVRLRRESVATALRQQPDVRFDVVIAVTPQPGAHAAPMYLSSEFYAAVRTQLKEDGVYCQRISQHDLGPQTLIRMMYSASSVFGRVVMLQMAPGEMAMVAGVQPHSLLDAGVLHRLQRDHVVRELAHSGWDWSQVAALPLIDSNNPVGIFDHTERLDSASATNGHFTFSLPLESIRWGNKKAELNSAFAPHQQRLAEAAPRSIAYDEFARRFSSVVQQHEILTNFPDQPWAYRKSLRMEMQRNPRPATETIHRGRIVRETHPLDQHRKDYFIALGEALRHASTGQIDPLTLRRLTQFTGQYEPLLTDFAHHEVVRIHEATGHQSPALELRHRLHTVYFTPPADFSVRVVTNAMRQVLDDPELLPTDDARFDQLNSMLQESVRRWQGRRGYDPPSAQQAQRDVDETIRMANRALDSLEDWAEVVGVSPQDMQFRRRFVNTALISPLRKYRTQVLAHRIKKRRPETPDGNDGSELPLLLDPADLLTN
jgi:hypothetical protein